MTWREIFRKEGKPYTYWSDKPAEKNSTVVVPCRASYVMPSQSIRTASTDDWHAGTITHVCESPDSKHEGYCECRCGVIFRKTLNR